MSEVPEEWITFIAVDSLPIHIYDSDKYACEIVSEYQKSVQKEAVDVEDCKKNIDVSRHPIMREIEPGDRVGYFASPEECLENYTKPIYAGYVLYRDGKQIGFELKVGSHNKALNWQASPAGTPKGSAH